MRDTFTKYAKDYYYETFGRPSDKTQDKDLDIRSGLVSFGEFIDLKSVTIVDTCHIHAFIRDNPQLNINFFRDVATAFIANHKRLIFDIGSVIFHCSAQLKGNTCRRT